MASKRQRSPSPTDKKQPAKKYLTTFNDSYTRSYPCIVRARGQDSKARCTICSIDISIQHGGINDCRKHVNSASHKNKAKAVQNTASIATFTKSSTSLDNAVTRAEALFTNFLVEHNITLAASDHAANLFKSMFLQGGTHSAEEIIKKYACGRTKTTHIVKELARQDQSSVIEDLKAVPFSLATDASNDSGDKLFPIVVRYSNGHAIKTELLSLFELEERSTGENIASMVVNDLRSKCVPLSNMVAFTSDNANNMVGAVKGTLGVLRRDFPNLLSTGCSCHRLHLACEWGIKQLPLSVENFFLDIYHYIEKSNVRNKKFKDHQAACGTPASKLVKHCPTRWLSLLHTCEWVIEQWEPLRQFFAEEVEQESVNKTSRLAKVHVNLKSRAMKLQVLFLKYVLQPINRANLELQSDVSKIHMQKRLCMRLIRELMFMFVRPSALTGKLVMDVDYKSKYNLKPLQDIMVGQEVKIFMTASKLETKKQEEFLSAVQAFLSTSVSYLLNNLQLDSELLTRAEVADTQQQFRASFESIKYFLDLCPAFLPAGVSVDDLEREFNIYQSLSISASDASMDKQWIELAGLRDDCGDVMLKNLPAFMLNILAIPHSNASCERIFSLVRRNHTEFRASMTTDILQSLLVLKQKGGCCYNQKFTKEVLDACKAATRHGLAGQASQED